ncbi:MAG: hypothetical protein WKF59_09860 [Chitinophagaceae bacterium]
MADTERFRLCGLHKKGVLHLEKLEKNFARRGCLWYNKIIPGFNTLNNFHITIYLKYSTGGENFDAIDFLWGDKGIYQLNFFPSGEVRLNYFNVKWDYPPNLNIKHLLSEDFDARNLNKYDLIQKDGFIYFMVNDIELLKQARKPMRGNSIGFQQCLKSAWEIDKIEIRQNKSTSATLYK